MKNSKYLTYLGLAVLFIMSLVLLTNIDTSKTDQLASIAGFSQDQNVKALWLFESSGFSNDSVGGNTLTNVGASASSDKKEGNASADFEENSSNYMRISDSSLSLGFPFKSGESNKEITIALWAKPESLDGQDMTLVGKYDSSGNARSFRLKFESDTARLLPQIGHSSGTGYEDGNQFGASLVAGRWYHIAMTINGNNKTYRLRVWDGTTNQLLSSDTTGTFTNDISLTNAEFTIGAHQRGINYFDGLIDEVVVFNRVLTPTEIDEVRAGSYGTGTPPPTTYQCNDGTDNDSDGLTDYPSDPGCSSTTDNDEYNAPSSDTTAPTTPTNLSATAISTSQINLTWAASTDAVGVTGYNIYRSGSLAGTSATNSYSNTGLATNTSYSYTIRAYDAAGNLSNNSSSVSATTLSSATPPPPTGGNAYYVSPTGNATWPNCTTINNPCRASNTEKSFLNAKAGETVYFLDGLYSGITYSEDNYRVPAWNPANNGTASNPITFKSLNRYGAHLQGYMPLPKSHIDWRPRVPVIGSNARDYIVWDGFTVSAVDSNGTTPLMAEVYFYDSAHHCTIKNSDIRGATHSEGGAVNYEGVRIESSDYVIVDSNLIHGFRETGNNLNTSAFKTYNSNYSVIKNNNIYDNTNGVFLKGQGIFYFSIYNNFFKDNTLNGLYISTSAADNSYHSVYNNIFVGGINSFNDIYGSYYADDLLVYNNTFVNASDSNLITNKNRVGHEASAYNNIFYNTKSPNNIVTRPNQSKLKSADHNLFYPNMRIILSRYTSERIYTSISSWISSGELASGGNPGSGSMISDPRFTNGSGTLSQISDFNLRTDSPAKGKGRNGLDIGADPSNVGVDGGGAVTPPPTPTPTYQCSDNLDNDSDGLTDYPSDPGCSSTTDNDEYNAPVIITDTQAPTDPTININSGSTLTNSTSVSLTLSATDNTAVTQMSFSTNGTTYSTWETYSTTKTYTLTSTNGTKIVYVRYRDAAGNISTSASDTISLDNTAPAISSISVTTTSSTTAMIKWNTNEPSTTQLEYGFSTNYGSQTTKNNSLVTSHTVNLINLSPDNTTYHYRVKSIDNINNEAISTDRTFVTPGLTDIISPSTITDLTASNITQTSANLNWTAPGDDGTTGTSAEYDIRYSTNTLTSANWPDATTVTGEPVPSISGSTETIYITVGLQANTTYYMGIRSKDDTGNLSSVSNIISFTTLAEEVTPVVVTPPGGGGGGGGVGITLDSTPPSQPTDFRAVSANNQVVLAWTNPEEKDFARVIVFRSTSIINTLNKTTDELRKTYQVVYEGKKQEYTDAKLNNSQNYYYAISSYDKVPNYSGFVTLSISPIMGANSYSSSSLEKTTVSTSEPISGEIFTENLWFGMENDNIRRLQELFAQDPTIYPEAIISGYYGTLTQKAVKRFQSKYDVVSSGSPETTGYGTVGPKTRAKINEVFAGILNILEIPIDANNQVATPVTDFIRLTIEQISAILNLLVAFGTDNVVVNTVSDILMGR